MTKVHLSIVSHNNEHLIKNNFFQLPRVFGDYELTINVIDNVGSNDFKDTCVANDINYYSDKNIRGYGENNNKNFELINPKDDDIFIVCNPDVTIQVNDFERLLNDFLERGCDIYGVKVFESSDLSKFSSHNRGYPALFDPVTSLIFKKKLFEKDPDVLANPDWIGGAFMVFKSSSFKKLGGFDKKFFMYYEDIDICRRAKRKCNMNIIYNPEFFIVHEAQREGRKIFSKHFLLNLTSMIKYFFRYPTLKLLTLKRSY